MTTTHEVVSRVRSTGAVTAVLTLGSLISAAAPPVAGAALLVAAIGAGVAIARRRA
jgi:hypothetical protein